MLPKRNILAFLLILLTAFSIQVYNNFKSTLIVDNKNEDSEGLYLVRMVYQGGYLIALFDSKESLNTFYKLPNIKTIDFNSLLDKNK